MSVIVQASREILKYERKGLEVRSVVYGARAREDLVNHYAPVSRPASAIVAKAEDKITLPFMRVGEQGVKVQAWFDPTRPIDYAIELK